jgi:hypothetical protein
MDELAPDAALSPDAPPIADAKTARISDETPSVDDAPPSDVPSGDVTPPVVVDLGRRGGRQIRMLKEGRGPLVGEVYDVIAQVRKALEADLSGKTLVPLVVVYKRKKKRARSGPTGLLPES